MGKRYNSSRLHFFRPWNLVKAIWIVFWAAVLSIFLLIYGVSIDAFGWFGGMPSLETLSNPKSEVASVVYSADGVELGKYFRENRVPATFETISPNMFKALYATEDIRFEDHSGIDLKGLISIVGYLAKGKRRGSSTITQQLAKNLFSTRGELYEGSMHKVGPFRTPIIKIKEWIVAVKLEATYTKKEIIIHYLNTVDFGSNSFGINVASRTFFGVAPINLTAEQSAMLVGLLKAPTYYSPILNPERSISRRNTVLQQMVKYDLLEKSKLDSLIAIGYDRSNYKVESHNQGMAAHFREELRKDLLQFCRENKLDLYADGLQIYTTIDSRLQAAGEEAVSKHMAFLQNNFNTYWKGKEPWRDESNRPIKNFVINSLKREPIWRQLSAQYEGNEDSIMRVLNRKVPMRVFTWQGDRDTVFSVVDSLIHYKKFLRAGLLSVQPSSGGVKAWVGGINYRYFKYDHIRQGRRQPGSVFKPILYTAAIDKGFTPCYEVVDEPVTWSDPTTGVSWTPQNSDGKYSYESLRLRTALARSVNSVAAALVMKVGPQTLVEYANRLGVESPLDPVPALALGSSDVSLYELVGAYSTFVNKGTWTKPYYLVKITDRHGNVIKAFSQERREVLNEEVAYTMIHMLRGATQEKGGTALGLHRWGKTLQGNEVAGKTGTTSNYSDGWFVGLTKDLVSGVWVGGDDRSIHFRSSQWGQGSRMALPIWSYYMDAAYALPDVGVTKGRFDIPKDFDYSIIQCDKPVNDEDGDADPDGPAKPPVYTPPAKLKEDF